MAEQSYQNGGSQTPRPRRQIYISQKLFRDPFKRPAGYNNEKCDLCGLTFQKPEEMEEHEKDEGHTVKHMYHSRRNALQTTIDGLQFQCVGFMDDDMGRLAIALDENETKTYELVMINNSKKNFHLLKVFEIFHIDDIHISNMNTNLQKQILPGDEVNFTMKVTLNQGAFLIPLIFKIKTDDEKNEDKKNNNENYILKEVIFRVQTELMERLAPVSKFKPLPNIRKEMVEEIIRYNKKGRKGLDENTVPRRLKNLMAKVKMCKEEHLSEIEKNEWKSYMALLEGPLTKENYQERFKLLLHLEELQSEFELLQFSETNIELEVVHGGMYKLDVPNLAEGRPSVLRGDSIYVRIRTNNKFRYEGRVIDVLHKEVLLDFNPKFKIAYKAGMKVDIQFALNRYPIKLAHHAIDLISKRKAINLIFPTDDGSKCTPKAIKQWKFQNIVHNMEQQQAVRHIVNKSAKPAPYLLFGPPGTGKTITIVESVVQVWLLNESKPQKQLVCAPTNSTADILAVKLISYIPKAKIIRVYALSFNPANKHAQIPLRCTNIQGQNIFKVSDIKNYDIVVMTIVCAGRLNPHELKNHFSYVYVDECGQAPEPDTLIPIAGILTTNDRNGSITGQLVLAGDPKQLGPVLESPLAKKYGLELSLLERLMTTNSIYMKDPVTKKYNDKYLTKLVQNFRSHEYILKTSNEMFYDNELQVKGEMDVITRGIGWSQLQNKKFPLIFHGIVGIEERECFSPSYFNRQEIDQVIKYIQLLLDHGLGSKKVKQGDIGVITPYRKQVEKLKRAFSLLNWTGVKVGSTEQFQGDERLIIIISTVRSTQEQLDEDYRFKLGFLKNEKRFNVAVTRAKALLIMVGNPHILCHDQHWRGFMNFVRNNNGSIGTNWRDSVN